MTYEEFEVEFERVHQAAGDGLGAGALQAEILRLRGLASSVEDPRERENAGHDIAMLDDLLAHDDNPPPSAARVEANAAYQAATTYDGTPAERIARAETGMADLARIAETAAPDEQAAILEMNESLHMLMTSLQSRESVR